MIRLPEHCPTAWLSDLLDQTLAPDRESEITKHLETCQSCQIRLQSLAADDAVWIQTRRYLSDGALQSTVHPWRTESVSPEDQIRRFLPHLAPSDCPDSLGQLDGYEVDSLIGWGGMGFVLKAIDPRLSRPVAVKVLHPHLAANGPARQRFSREARAAAAVNHASVVPIHAVDADHDPPYLVMAFIPGGSLQDRIDAHGPLEIDECLRVGLQIAEGLAAAHRQGLVHRDIKPANILLDHGQDRAMLTDFGLAQALDDAGQTCSGTIAGTPQYMSPEQARGLPVDARSDVFSLGSVFYAMLTGRPPFRGDSSLRVLNQIQEDTPRPIAAIRPSIPTWLDRLVQQMLAKNPKRRLQSAEQTAALLRQCLSHRSAPHDHPLPVELCDAGRFRPGASAARLVIPIALLLLMMLSTVDWPTMDSTSLPPTDRESSIDVPKIQPSTSPPATIDPPRPSPPADSFGPADARGREIPPFAIDPTRRAAPSGAPPGSAIDASSQTPIAASPALRSMPTDVTAWDDGLEPVLSQLRERLSRLKQLETHPNLP
ncbi:serine/threonine-protein kinase [Crateriforma conspicua]|uniref:serine/threonine-protein kinase n=1 Tax=Crateriforma conspicua TaxID=2527996 RepID=UPI001187EBA4|nr:serine/threonine-protein kinase [Crateriforma conspicua]QDV65293.1 Serine/threonine-protein kinase PknB [Crateriforma conspicua]